jgi:hypothetical protein
MGPLDYDLADLSVVLDLSGSDESLVDNLRAPNHQRWAAILNFEP